MSFNLALALDLEETFMLKLSEKSTALKKIQKIHKLSYRELLLSRNSILVQHLETKCLSHVLLCVKTVRILRKLPYHVNVVLIPLLLSHTRDLFEQLQIFFNLFLVIRQLPNQIVNLFHNGLMLTNP